MTEFSTVEPRQEAAVAGSLALPGWKTWIEQAWRKRARTFDNEPMEMSAAYRRERKSVQEYHGREILELLQNADDAGVGFGENKAMIELTPSALYVANTGVPFSAAGVESLMISDASPKHLSRNQYIGNRGLGFRSVLNWSSGPVIVSGDLRLGFSREHVARKLRELVAGNDDMRRLVEQERAAGRDCPIPILSCPSLPGDGDAVSHADELRGAGYDTIIALPFTRNGAFEQVQGQIDELLKHRELMLFLQSLVNLVVVSPNGRQEWAVERKGSSVSVRLDGADDAVEWSVRTRNGQVPPESLDEANQLTPGYEIKIAVSNTGNGAGLLFNYFPTKVKFPYPVVAHATFDLTPNRDNLVESKTNRYLAGQLADALAEAAESLPTDGDVWRPLRLITRGSAGLDYQLEQFGFENSLLESAKTKRIIPRRDGSFGASDTQRLPFNPDGWLPLNEFGDVARWADSLALRSTQEQLGVSAMSANDLRIRLNRLSPALTVPDRARLISGLVLHAPNLVTQNPPPKLLIDRDGALVEPEISVYIPGQNQRDFEFPEWMPLRFVSSNLIDALVTELRLSREELAERLRCFNLHQYKYDALASAINARINARCEEPGMDERAARIEGLQILKRLFETLDREDIPKRRPNLRVKVLTRRGEWRPADELYLGEPFPGGGLMEALLGNLHPEEFIAPPTELGHDGDAAKWEALLRWLGADVWLREREVENPGTLPCEFTTHVRNSIRYPADFDDLKAASDGELRWVGVQTAMTVDHLDEILTAAPAEAVLAWVAKDLRIESWRTNGDPKVKLGATLRTSTYRILQRQNLPSFVVWALRNRPWLPASDGETHKPVECVQGKIPSDEIRRLFPQPGVDRKGEMLGRLNVDADSVWQAFVRVGVCMNLDDLPWDRWYEILLNLPKIEASGQTAVELYRILVGKDADDDIERQERRSTFLRNGQLWCRSKEVFAYRPVRDGIYVIGDPTLPKAVAKELNVLDLPKKRGMEKPQRIFGVKILRPKDVNMRVTQAVPLPRSDLLDQEAAALKPFVFAVRLDASPQAPGAGKLRNLKFIGCARVEAVATHARREIPVVLTEPGEILIDQDTAYIVCSEIPAQNPLAMPLGYSVSEVFATVLEVDRAADFACMAIVQRDIRHETLAQLLGHQGSEGLERAYEALRTHPETEETPIPNFPARAIKASQTTPAAVSQQQQVAPTSQTADIAPPETPGLPAQVASARTAHTPQPTRTIPLRVQSQSVPRDRIQRTKRVPDGKRCEELAVLFEESCGRFPLPVGPIQGEDAYGCDILSFASAEDCELFRGGKAGDGNLVRRFIEVKGRGNPAAPIHLAGNQLTAAQRFAEQYYIYRVYEAVAGEEWQIGILQNPLAYDWPMIFTVSPLQRSEAECWTVTAFSGKES